MRLLLAANWPEILDWWWSQIDKNYWLKTWLLRNIQETLMSVCKTQHTEKLQTCLLPRSVQNERVQYHTKTRDEKLRKFSRAWTKSPQHVHNTLAKNREEEQVFILQLTEAEQVCSDQDTEESHTQPGETRGGRVCLAPRHIPTAQVQRYTVKKGKIYK